ncbi:outer membrane lipoprotein-sorting protein [Desulfopila sp. IMCC35008]|uniref:outer membrane lipoprotein-sorting protein n=1 Tax=Desulfopila sp. IMCC35008 TaxID=2653858 RepID=UPI0013D66FC7|nr:outer membrane lipoprotein-sorting protein [Desulfopila sp. IMCC35008]
MYRSAFHLFSTLFALLLFLPTSSLATSADEIIKKVEGNLNGESAILHFAMVVTTGRGERTMKMESYSIGVEKSFIKIIYPGKDKGITFLKIDNNMWQYIPRIEKIIKIPASMMLQSWMGSDFTNDDLVKESSLSKDYRTTLIEENGKEYTLNLAPLEHAPVVWGRIVMQVSKQYSLPTTVQYFDEDGIRVRTLEYTDVKKFNDRYYPTAWLMTPLDPDKKDHRTSVKIDYALFNSDLNPNYFTKQALKRYSR